MAASQVTVLVMAPPLSSERSYIEALDPRLRVLDGGAAYLSELREKGIHSRRQLPEGTRPASKAERDRLLQSAEVVVMSHPVLPDLRARAPQLRWLHHVQAGVSNLWGTDIWDSDVTLTTARGAVGTTSIAEFIMAGVLYFARGLHDSAAAKAQGQLDRTTRQRMVPVRGATLGIIGLGGIGREAARLGKALGMKVLATRRTIQEEQHNVEGVDVLLPPRGLLDMARESDFLAFCAQLTPETLAMVNRQVFEAMKPTAVFINVARGEVVNEDDLVEALRMGRIRGAVLDVYEGELAGGPPRQEFMDWPQVLLTPHIAAQRGAGPDESMRGLLCENLRRYLAGEPLINVVDRARGY